MSYDFYRTGKQDCGNTFDRETFADISIRELASRTAGEVRALKRRDPRRAHSFRKVASEVALDALRGSEDWIEANDWVRGTDFDPKEDGPLDEAYASWKAGYIDCAVPELTEWIMDEIGERS